MTNSFYTFFPIKGLKITLILALIAIPTKMLIVLIFYTQKKRNMHIKSIIRRQIQEAMPDDSFYS